MIDRDWACDESDIGISRSFTTIYSRKKNIILHKWKDKEIQRNRNWKNGNSGG